MVLNVHRNHKAYQVRGERGGERVGGGEEREIIYLSLHCHHQNDFCIKMGSDENQFNVSLFVRDKVTRQHPLTTTFEVKGEPKQIRTEVPPLTSLPLYRLGQTGLQIRWMMVQNYIPSLSSLTRDRVALGRCGWRWNGPPCWRGRCASRCPPPAPCGPGTSGR